MGIVIISESICKALGIRGIMLFPFCIVRGLGRWYNRSKQLVTINHERIHFKQCLECGIIGFYIIYGIFHLMYGYERNPFEREAFDNDNDLTYNKHRKLYAWVKYLKR